MIEVLIEKLKPHSDTPRLDAELFIAAIMNQPRTQLFAHPEQKLTSTQEQALKKYVTRRINNEPVAYILGHKEFWSLDFKVTPDVLIPRPETEMLVEWALENLPEKEKIHIADLGTGSGAIAIALAYERSSWIIDATDSSEEALNIAKENANWHRINNINFYCGPWCQALPEKNYHAILGNPPYISSNDTHLQNLQYEPQSALNGGNDGLGAIKIIIKEAKNFLLNDGYLVLEHGYDQSGKIIELMEQNHYREVNDFPDLANIPRMIIGRKGYKIKSSSFYL